MGYDGVNNKRNSRYAIVNDAGLRTVEKKFNQQQWGEYYTMLETLKRQ